VANAHWLNSNIVHGKIERRAKSVLDFARLFLPNELVITEVNYATRKKNEIQKQKESKETVDGPAKTVDGSEELKFFTQRCGVFQFRDELSKHWPNLLFASSQLRARFACVTPEKCCEHVLRRRLLSTLGI
jgi:hypothetical protein